MTSTFTPNINLEEPANSDYVNNWNVPVNSNFTILDTAIGGNTVINVVGAASINSLTLTQYQNRILIFSGSMTINQTWQFPAAVGGIWYIVNITTGAFSLTLKTAASGGTTVTCGQGVNTIILSDGTNVLLGQSSPAQAAGSPGQLQFNNSGVLGAATGLNYDTVNNVLNSPNFGGNLTGSVSVTAVVGTSGPLVGYRNIPISSNTTPVASDVGKFLYLTTACTISSGVFSVGDVFVLVNRSTSPISVNQGSGTLLVLGGTTSTGNRTIQPNGAATFFSTDPNFFIVSGPGVS